MNQKLLEDEFDIGSEQIEALFRFAKCQYQCGNYGSAAELLNSYGLLCTDPEQNLAAMWGRFAANILLQNFTTANEDHAKLKDLIEKQVNVDPLKQLQQRTWLMHWSLFVFWNHKNGHNSIIELFLQVSNFN